MIPNNVLNIINRMIPNIGNLQNVNTPDDMAQFLLNSGKVNQEQVNRAKSMWGNPQVRQQINNQYRY